ncbi:MAG: hypothetical protein HC893_14280, partial [Chloroflexaceae bacterium]|nr:hypothetical protein [Chloroflexaceae bacterium]
SSKEDPNTRSLNRFWATLVALLALGMSSFYVYTAGTLPARCSISVVCMWD